MNSDEQNSPSQITVNRFEIDTAQFNKQPDNHALPVLPMRSTVLMPNTIAPIALGRELSVRLADAACQHCRPVGVVCQLDGAVENPGLDDLFGYGVYADVVKIINLPDGSKTAILRTRGRFQLVGHADGDVQPWVPEDSLLVSVRKATERRPVKTSEYETVLENIHLKFNEYLQHIEDSKASELRANIRSYESAEQAVNFLCMTLPLAADDKMRLLAANTHLQRAAELLELLCQLLQKIAVSKEIMERAMGSVNETNRANFLHQQMEAIREELYGDTDDSEQLRKRADEIGLPDNARAVFDKELAKLRRFNPNTPDYGLSHSYLETILELPWGKYDETNTDFAKARDILEADHFGLDKVKERILEQMAVLVNNPGGKAPILCLVGPPGVGKTSLG